MANKIELSHERTSKGSSIQHILVNGIELSGRTVTKSADSELFDTVIGILNEKAQEELVKNPRFAWTRIEEWRKWANPFVNEVTERITKEKEDAILKSIEENNK